MSSLDVGRTAFVAILAACVQIGCSTPSGSLGYDIKELEREESGGSYHVLWSSDPREPPWPRDPLGQLRAT